MGDAVWQVVGSSGARMRCKTTLTENLAMITDSIRYLCQQNRRVYL